jgi:hypothetical protein
VHKHFSDIGVHEVKYESVIIIACGTTHWKLHDKKEGVKSGRRILAFPCVRIFKRLTLQCIGATENLTYIYLTYCMLAGPAVLHTTTFCRDTTCSHVLKQVHGVLVDTVGNLPQRMYDKRL